MNDLITVTESQAKKLEALGVEVEVVYAVKRTTVDLFKSLDAKSYKRKRSRKPNSNDKTLYIRQKRMRGFNPGSNRHKALKQLDKAHWVNGTTMSLMDIKKNLVAASIPPHEVAWTVRELVRARDIVEAED